MHLAEESEGRMTEQEYWLTPDEIDYLEQWFGKSNIVIPLPPLYITGGHDGILLNT